MTSMSTRSRGLISSPASTLSSPSLSSSSASSSISSMSSMSSVSPTSSPRSIPSGSNNSNMYQYSPPAIEPQLNPATRAYMTSTSSLANPRTQDDHARIIEGRNIGKKLRGEEVIWPPELEAALNEGLENYHPDDSRETRLLERRNSFLSDWIFERTGRRRSAKQVGSRLQQLRDTFGGKKFMKLLSRPASMPVVAKFQDDEPDAACSSHSLSPKTYMKDPGDGQWGSTRPNEAHRQQDGRPTQEMERALLGPLKHLAPPARPGRESAERVAMFTNAHINTIHGGTFLNVVQIYECESGSKPLFLIMVFISSLAIYFIIYYL